MDNSSLGNRTTKMDDMITHLNLILKETKLEVEIINSMDLNHHGNKVTNSMDPNMDNKDLGRIRIKDSIIQDNSHNGNRITITTNTCRMIMDASHQWTPPMERTLISTQAILRPIREFN